MAAFVDVSSQKPSVIRHAIVVAAFVVHPGAAMSDILVDIQS